MKRLLSLGAFALLLLSPSMALAQSSMATMQYGVGPHGFDYFIGTWTCKNSMASDLSGPSTSTLTISPSPAGSSLYFRVKGQKFDSAGYVSYSAKTKTWLNPAAFADGSYSFESTTQTGKKTTWTGTYYNAASGTTAQIRDTYTLFPGHYTDLNETKSGGAWKTTGNSTCTKE